MELPIISIVVPCYNQSQYLPDALHSVLAQTVSNWECIIINDNSPDNTEQVAQSFIEKDKRFKYLFVDNKGVSVARNRGIELAVGKYILPLDADDKIAPCYLEKGIEAFEQDPELKVVYGEAELFGDMSGKWLLEEYSYTNLLSSNMIYCSAIFKHNDFLDCGGYSPELVYGYEDWDFWIRLLRDGGKVLRLPDVVFFYRRKFISRSTELNVENRKEITFKSIIRRNSDIYSEHLYDLLSDINMLRKKALELDNIHKSKTYLLSKMLVNLSRIIHINKRK